MAASTEVIMAQLGSKNQKDISPTAYFACVHEMMQNWIRQNQKAG